MLARVRRCLPALALLVAIAVVYAPGRHNRLIEWDDAEYIRDNPALTAPDGLRRIWTPTGQPQFYPLTFTAYWLQYRLWGPEPAGYYAVQVALHAANALLVAALARRLGTSRAAAWLAAALFALHPVQVASVAWLAELKNGLSGMLALAAAWLYLGRQGTGNRERGAGNGERGTGDGKQGTGNREPETGSIGFPPVGPTTATRGWGWGKYGLSAMLFLGALLSKTAVMGLPLSLWAAERWVCKRRGRGIELRAAGLLALAVAAAIVTIVVEHDRSIEVGGAPAQRPFAAAAAVWFYVGKLLLPIRQPALYAAWSVDLRSPAWWLPLLGLVLAAIAAWRWRRRLGGLTRWGAIHFLALIAPTLGLVPFGYLAFAPVADHFLHLALVGPCVAAAVALANWGARGTAARRGVVIVIASVVPAALGVRSWQQVHVWRDAGTLWSHTLKYNPGSATAHNNLGLYLERQGDWPAARAHYTEATRLKPTYAEAHNNLGGALIHLGEFEAALTACRRAIQLQPQFAEAYNNLGTVLGSLGRTEEAAVQFEHATRLRPSLAAAHANRGAALLQLGRLDEAIACCREALRRNEADAHAHLTLASTLARRGDTAEAILHYEAALRWRPDWPDATLALAWTLATWHDAGPQDVTRAVQLAERVAADLDRPDPWVLDTLGAAYAAAGRFDDAVRVAEQARGAAESAGLATPAQQIDRRLALYRTGQPFRAPSVPQHPPR
ncbi:MAG: tetratricopeptide repeat protein [Planctomycetota bacterium]